MRKAEQVFWGRCELLESRAVMGIAAERNSLGETGSFYWLDHHFYRYRGDGGVRQREGVGGCNNSCENPSMTNYMFIKNYRKMGIVKTQQSKTQTLQKQA